jgi:uncharacterized protein
VRNVQACHLSRRLAWREMKPARNMAKSSWARVVSLWHSGAMDKGRVIATLREHQAELEAAGVVHLRLHGSVARGDASDASDVDLIADFDAARKYSLLDRVALENRLAEILGVPVEVSPAAALKDSVRREAVLAF